MIKISITGNKSVTDMLAAMPRQARRAMEMALDSTAKSIKVKIQSAMQSTFKSLVPWTRNSLKVTPTKGHNMLAYVGFKEPDRMAAHYLVAQVEGGARQLKGFEVAIKSKDPSGHQFAVSRDARTTSQGNITVAQSKGLIAGINKGKGADYFILKERRGRLAPGVYQRMAIKGTAIRGKGARGVQKSAMARSGRFASAITARGVRAILLQRKGVSRYSARLPFYQIAQSVARGQLELAFWRKLAELVSK